MKPTFSEIATSWKADKRPWIKKSSYAIYTQLTNSYILPYFSAGERPLCEETIQAFVNQLFERGYSNKTVRDTMLVLKMILAYGTRTGAWPHIEYKVRYPADARDSSSPTVLTRPQHHRLQEYLRAHLSFQNLGILICLHSGMRIGEICALQWRDLDVAAGVIHVTKTVQRIYIHDGDYREYSLQVDSPKTPSSIRDIPLSQELKGIIRPLRRVLRAEDYVVSNRDIPLEPRYYRNYYYRLLDSLSLPHVRFHALRHSFATRCIESKCDYKTVSVLLGHASISTTMDLYVHPGYDEKKKAVEQMLRRLG